MVAFVSVPLKVISSIVENSTADNPDLAGGLPISGRSTVQRPRLIARTEERQKSAF